jgi:AcrR family transcriptional regulator
MTRPYEAPSRQAQAQETRHRIVTAARELMLDGGYARMTIADLARAAGVSAQTVYNSVGGKAEVVRAVYDVMLAGDEEPVPMSSRPEFRAVVEAADVSAWAAAYAGIARMIQQRVGPLLGALLAHGPAGDPVLEELVATIDRQRRIGNEEALKGLAERGLLPARTPHSRLVDAVWVLTAPEVYDRLVRRLGWSATAYERWLSAQLRAALTAT